MNILQVVRGVHEALGEPSDLQYWNEAADKDTPDQDAATNSEYYRNWRLYVDALNNACLAIACWKFPNNKMIRFRSLEEVATFQSHLRPIEVTNISGNIFQYISTNPAYPVDLTPDAYKDCMIRQESTNANLLVIRSWTAVGMNYLLVASAGSAVVGADFFLHKRDYSFANVDFNFQPITSLDIPFDYRNGRPLEIIDVIDASTGTQLEYEVKYDHLLGQTPAVGTPASFYKKALGLRFDVWPTDIRGYFVRFLRGPRQIGYADDVNVVEPELPIQFHEAIRLWMIWWGLRRMEENNSAYSTKKDLDDVLLRTQTEEDMQDRLTPGQMKLWPNGR